ncbi:DUF2783 domain-containing protein [Sphingomonas koreensis]
MAGLITDPNINGVDDVYERLIAALDGRSLEDSLKVAVRLNLILINHVGDREVIEGALALAAGQPRG